MKEVWVPFATMMFCLIGAAVNIAFFVAVGNPINLGAAVLCGGLAIFNGLLVVNS